MNSDYVFLCGVMWCGYGKEEARYELIRAIGAANSDVGALAWAMLMKGMAQFNQSSHPTLLKEWFGLGTADTLSRRL